MSRCVLFPTDLAIAEADNETTDSVFEHDAEPEHHAQIDQLLGIFSTGLGHERLSNVTADSPTITPPGRRRRLQYENKQTPYFPKIQWSEEPANECQRCIHETVLSIWGIGDICDFTVVNESGCSGDPWEYFAMSQVLNIPEGSSGPGAMIWISLHWLFCMGTDCCVLNVYDLGNGGMEPLCGASPEAIFNAMLDTFEFDHPHLELEPSDFVKRGKSVSRWKSLMEKMEIAESRPQKAAEKFHVVTPDIKEIRLKQKQKKSNKNQEPVVIEPDDPQCASCMEYLVESLVISKI